MRVDCAKSVRSVRPYHMPTRTYSLADGAGYRYAFLPESCSASLTTPAESCDV